MTAPDKADKTTTPSGSNAKTREPGAPVPRDEIDPELIKLRRPPLRIGLLSSAAMVLVGVFFIFRLAPDRHFGGLADKPTVVSVKDILANNVSGDQFVTFAGEPLTAHTIRVTRTTGNPGLRAAPVRGSSDRVWLVLPGGAMTQINEALSPQGIPQYQGRLRKLNELRFAGVMRAYANQHPRPVFAPVAAIRNSFTAGNIVTVTGDTVTAHDNDRVVVETTDPDAAKLMVTYHDKMPDLAAWQSALSTAGLITVNQAPDKTTFDTATFTLRTSNAVVAATQKLEAAQLLAYKLEPVVRNLETTFAGLRASTAGTLTFGPTVIADAQIDLIGVYAAREIPSDAYALVVGETPSEYWHIRPLTIALGLLTLLFGWSFVRTLRRDVLPRSLPTT
ncbi:MAG: hypothetical protein KBG15_12185 [Kofleriaceae bacterium]|nr:hypothetical protein [Kofleriaceae bacterium]